ncbi:MAG: adenylate/guanylate cyclase domain-containing protein [Campylobacterota bacterium]|nr:adenylate/guanylate cyclase domain-containing protein [Campylobacterota bacterium]
MNTKLFQTAAITLAAIIITLVTYKLQLLAPIENHLWDYRVKLLADPAKHDPSIKIVLIDQSSLDWAEASNGLSWPWPREMYTTIADFCLQGGAKAIIFDMLFLEPSLYGTTDDERFGAALKEGEAIGAVVLSNEQGSTTSWPDTPNNQVNTPANAPLPEALVKEKAAFPVESLAGTFSALGSIVATPDKDGVIRQVQLMSYFDNIRLPVLSLATYLNSDHSVKYRQDEKQFCLNNHCERFNTDYKALINFHGPSQTYASVNAAAVIDSKLLLNNGEKASLSPDFFKDSYVFIGVSAPGLMDLKTTPIQGVYPGVEVHATVLDNLLNNDFVSKTPFSLMFVMLIALTLFNSAGIRFHDSLLQASLYPLVSLATITGAGVFAYSLNSWLELAPLILALLLSSISAFGLNYLIEGRQRRFIKTAFAQYISPKVIDSLIQEPETLKLGGREETLTILFSDIEGFTKISSQMEAGRVAEFLNEYLGLLSNAIMNLGGTIDKYEGDAIIAFWNAPLPQPDHALLAVEAALQCQQLLQKNHDHFLKTYGHTVKTRFGIHTGKVIIGNLGTDKRFDYTFIGDAGNLAARLESANKQFGSYVMISETTKAALNDRFYYRELGHISVVGRDEPICVFEPIYRDDAQREERLLKQYDIALALLYKKDLHTAQQQFAAIAESDPVSKKYLEIIDNIEDGKLVFENGVIRLSEK